MRRSRDLLVEDRETDGLNVLPRLIEGGNVYDCFGFDPVDLPENHCAFMLLRSLLDPADEVGCVRDLNQTPHIVLIVRRQIFQTINALVDVRQRKQIQYNINGGQHPDEEAVADEIASERG